MRNSYDDDSFVRDLVRHLCTRILKDKPLLASTLKVVDAELAVMEYVCSRVFCEG